MSNLGFRQFAIQGGRQRLWQGPHRVEWQGWRFEGRRRDLFTGNLPTLCYDLRLFVNISQRTDYNTRLLFLQLGIYFSKEEYMYR